MSGLKRSLCLLWLVPCLVWSLDSDELDLPSVTIEGKDELQKKEQFYFDDDLSEQWQIEGDFDFDVGLQDLDFASKKDTTGSNLRVGFFDFWLGYGHKAQLKSVYHSLQNELLDFEFESKNFYYDPDWYSLRQSFLWSPNFGRTEIDFSFEQLDASADSLVTKVLEGGFSWNLAILDTLLESVSISFFAQELQQDKADVTKTKSFSNFAISPVGTIKDVLLSADLFHYADVLNAEFKAHKNVNDWGFYTVDFWAGISQDKIMPSVGFLGLYFLPNKIFFHIENAPSISKKTHFELLSENYAQDLDYELLQEIVPLDLTIKSGYKRYFSLFNNISYRMNHICYSKAADQQSYLLDEEDFLLNKSGAQASVDYKGYRLSLSSYLMMVLNSPKDYIAYEPANQAKASLSCTMFDIITNELSFVVERLIKDEDGQQLDDKFELNLEQSWNFTQELSLSLRLLNLLDNKLNKLPIYPERGPQIYAGVKYYF